MSKSSSRIGSLAFLRRWKEGCMMEWWRRSSLDQLSILAAFKYNHLVLAWKDFDSIWQKKFMNTFQFQDKFWLVVNLACLESKPWILSSLLGHVMARYYKRRKSHQICMLCLYISHNTIWCSLWYDMIFSTMLLEMISHVL